MCYLGCQNSCFNLALCAGSPAGSLRHTLTHTHHLHKRKNTTWTSDFIQPRTHTLKIMIVTLWIFHENTPPALPNYTTIPTKRGLCSIHILMPFMIVLKYICSNFINDIVSWCVSTFALNTTCVHPHLQGYTNTHRPFTHPHTYTLINTHPTTHPHPLYCKINRCLIFEHLMCSEHMFNFVILFYKVTNYSCCQI